MLGFWRYEFHFSIYNPTLLIPATNHPSSILAILIALGWKKWRHNKLGRFESLEFYGWSSHRIADSGLENAGFNATFDGFNFFLKNKI